MSTPHAPHDASRPNDFRAYVSRHLPTALGLGIALTGIWMRYVVKVDVIAVKEGTQDSEKIKVLNDNLAELRDLAQDALDDAVLMGGTQAQIKQTLLEIIEGLDSQYPEQTS